MDGIRLALRRVRPEFWSAQEDAATRLFASLEAPVRRASLALPLAALALAAASPARADPAPRIAVRLDYLRGPGGESCPQTDSGLRAIVPERMGYDPFDPSVPPRLAVVI